MKKIVSAVLLMSIMIATPATMSAESYADFFTAGSSIKAIQENCTNQASTISRYTARKKAVAKRYTYCSSEARVRGVTKFLDNLSGEYTTGSNHIGDAIAVITSDSRMLDALMSGWSTRLKDTGWNSIVASEWAFGDASHAIMGILENRGEKDPQQRYRFYIAHLKDGQYGTELEVNTQRIAFESDDTDPFETEHGFDFADFNELLREEFKNSWLSYWSPEQTEVLREFSKHVQQRINLGY